MVVTVSEVVEDRSVREHQDADAAVAQHLAHPDLLRAGAAVGNLDRPGPDGVVVLVRLGLVDGVEAAVVLVLLHGRRQQVGMEHLPVADLAALHVQQVGDLENVVRGPEHAVAAEGPAVGPVVGAHRLECAGRQAEGPVDLVDDEAQQVGGFLLRGAGQAADVFRHRVRQQVRVRRVVHPAPAWRLPGGEGHGAPELAVLVLDDEEVQLGRRVLLVFLVGGIPVVAGGHVQQVLEGHALPAVLGGLGQVVPKR